MPVSRSSSRFCHTAAAESSTCPGVADEKLHFGRSVLPPREAADVESDLAAHVGLIHHHLDVERLAKP
jgi:hypothetical protein